jgi:hypothetical protein
VTLNDGMEMVSSAAGTFYYTHSYTGDRQWNKYKDLKRSDCQISLRNSTELIYDPLIMVSYPVGKPPITRVIEDRTLFRRKLPGLSLFLNVRLFS